MFIAEFFRHPIPSVSGNFSNSKNIYIEEFLTFHNRRDEMEYYLTEEYFNKHEFDLIQSFKELYVIGEFKIISPNEAKGEFLSLNKREFILNNYIFEKYGKNFHEKPLSGKFKIQYSESDNIFHILDFEKLEWDVNLDDWNNFRKQFTLKDWTSILLEMLGFNPNNLFFREKIIILSRILPLLEENFAFLELGPKSVGKSRSYNLLKEHNFITSGSSATLANTIIDNTTKVKGYIFKTKNLVFDEITTDAIDPKLMAQIQMYLSDEEIRRTGNPERIFTSITFLGNLKMDENLLFRENTPSYLDKFGLGKDPIAMLDRINLLNPSWGMRPIKNDMTLNEEQLVNSKRIPMGFFSKIVSLLRKEKVKLDFNKLYPLDYSKRTSGSIIKSFSALIKLFAPDFVNISSITCERNVLDSLFFIACEHRYVIDKILEKHDKQYKEFNFFDVNVFNNMLINFENFPLYYNNNFTRLTTSHAVFFQNKNNNQITAFALDYLGQSSIDKLPYLGPIQVPRSSNSTQTPVSHVDYLGHFSFTPSNTYDTIAYNVVHQNMMERVINITLVNNIYNPIFQHKKIDLNLLFGYSYWNSTYFEYHLSLFNKNNFCCHTCNCHSQNMASVNSETLICNNCRTLYDSHTLKRIEK